MPEPRASTKTKKNWRSSFVLRVGGETSNPRIELFDLRTGQKLEFESFQGLTVHLEQGQKRRGLH
jgi:hypothetical protein